MLENGQVMHIQYIKKTDLEAGIPEGLLFNRKKKKMNNVLMTW